MQITTNMIDGDVVFIVPIFAMTHSDLINLWPSLGEFAADIGAAYESAKAMRRRGSVPSGYWKHMVSAAERRGIDGVTYERLADAVAVCREAAE